MADDETAAVLAAIEERRQLGINGITPGAFGPADPVAQCEALANLADVDVPRLLAAVDSALGVVAEMEAHEDPLPSSALTEDRAWVRAEWASRLRERIALALVG